MESGDQSPKNVREMLAVEDLIGKTIREANNYLKRKATETIEELKGDLEQNAKEIKVSKEDFKRELEKVKGEIRSQRAQINLSKGNVGILEQIVTTMKKKLESGLKEGREAFEEMRKTILQLGSNVKRLGDEVPGYIDSVVSSRVEARVSGAASAAAPPPSHRNTSSAPSQPLTPEQRRSLGMKLYRAILERNEAEVSRLLAEGADIEVTNERGNTPLIASAGVGDLKTIILLLRKGANVSARGYLEVTPLLVAAAKDHSGYCLCVLIGGGADVNEKTSLGYTPLHFAALWGNVACVKALLVTGANKTAKDNKGRTPLDVTKSDEVKQLLR